MTNEVKTKCDRNLPIDADPKYFDDPAPHVDTWMSDRSIPFETPPEVRDRDAFESIYVDPEPERSLRYNNGKPDFSLLPMSTLTEVVRVLEYGASKYARNNWLKPTSWDVSFACLMRHMSAWQAGEDNDPESGCNHLAHAACNILQMLHQLEHYPEELER